jgi:hypothetical protein
MKSTLLYPVFIMLFMTFMLVDSATLRTTAHTNTRNNSNDNSFALQMLRRFSQWFSSNKEQALDCPQDESAELVLFSEWTNRTQWKTTKAKLLENGGSLFHKMLALDQKGIMLPHEIGI